MDQSIAQGYNAAAERDAQNKAANAAALELLQTSAIGRQLVGFAQENQLQCAVTPSNPDISVSERALLIGSYIGVQIVEIGYQNQINARMRDNNRRFNTNHVVPEDKVFVGETPLSHIPATREGNAERFGGMSMINDNEGMYREMNAEMDGIRLDIQAILKKEMATSAVAAPAAPTGTMERKS